MPMVSPIVLSVLAFLQPPATTSTAPAASAGATTATAPATSTAPTQPGPAKVVEWHGQYDPAAQQARKQGRLLLVVYYDPDAPASQTFEETTLSDRRTREFLSAFAAVKLNATRGPGKQRFAKTGAAEAPLTQVFGPEGELLDFRPGCVIPASAFRERLGRSLAYWEAAKAKPFDAAARWKAVQARLLLATREKAAPHVDKLLKLPAKKLPEGLTPALLHLTRAAALFQSKPEAAEEDLRKVRQLAGDDPDVGGGATLLLAERCFRSARHKQAHELCAEYIRKFPKAPQIGRAYQTRALVEFLGLNDAEAAAKTLRKFMAEYPNDPAVVQAGELLEVVERAKKKGAEK